LPSLSNIINEEINSSEHSPSWEDNGCSAGKKFTFIEPKGSLQCSQHQATVLYPEPDKISPHLHNLFL